MTKAIEGGSPLPALTLDALKSSARDFLASMAATPQGLFGVTDGKAVGTHVEHAFHQHLSHLFTYEQGNSANGIDFPSVEVDLKVTSVRQPQSSCPFHNAREKVYGLGYHLMVLVYDKTDDQAARKSILTFPHAIFVSRERTGDYVTTSKLRDLLGAGANKEDIIGFLEDRNLPLDEIGRNALAEEIMRSEPSIGYLTISNALQWRLQYSRAIEFANMPQRTGVETLLA